MCLCSKFIEFSKHSNTLLKKYDCFQTETKKWVQGVKVLQLHFVETLVYYIILEQLLLCI